MRRAHVAIDPAQTRLDRVDRRRAGSIPPRWRAGSPAAARPPSATRATSAGATGRGPITFWIRKRVVHFLRGKIPSATTTPGGQEAQGDGNAGLGGSRGAWKWLRGFHWVKLCTGRGDHECVMWWCNRFGSVTPRLRPGYGVRLRFFLYISYIYVYVYVM